MHENENSFTNNNKNNLVKVGKITKGKFIDIFSFALINIIPFLFPFEILF